MWSILHHTAVDPANKQNGGGATGDVSTAPLDAVEETLEKKYEQAEEWDDWEEEEVEEKQPDPERRATHPLIDSIVHRRKRKKSSVNAGVQESVYVNWINAELTKEAECLELPFTILLLLVFALLSTTFMGQDTIIIVERAITDDIIENANFAWAHNFGHKNVNDVNSYADFWSWTRLGFLPLVAPSQPWGYSQDLDSAVEQVPGQPMYDTSLLPTRRPFPGHNQPVPVRNDYLRYNRIIGGFRFRQEVANVSIKQCKMPGDFNIFSNYLGKPCTQRTDYELPPDLYATEEFAGPERTEWLISDIEPPLVLIQHAIDMEDGCTSAVAQNRTCLCRWCIAQKPLHPWLNEMTMRAEIAFVVYNAQYGIYSKATVNFWFNRAGHIHKLVNVQSSWAGLEVRGLWTLMVILGSGLVWIFCCLYVFKSEGREILELIRTKNKKWFMTMVDDYISFWNCVDWLSIFIACFILGSFLSLLMRINSVSGGLGEIAEVQQEGSLDEKYIELIHEFYTLVEAMNASERSFRFVLCIYPLVLMMRLFKSFAAQPRLAVVTDTFKTGRIDIIHFFIVFSSVYFCMTVNSVLFFGQDNIDFSTLDRALHSCFRAMLGDWDWDGMRGIGRLKAFAWFFLFMLVMVLVLLNMLLAIVMDAYSNVKGQAENADSLFMQMYNMHRRWAQFKRGERVRLNDIWDALLRDWNMDDEKMLTSKRRLFPERGDADEFMSLPGFNPDHVGFLKNIVPDIKMEQAARTLKNSQAEFDRVNSEPFTERDLEGPFNKMLARTADSVMSAGWLVSKLQYYEELDAADHEADDEDDPDFVLKVANSARSPSGQNAAAAAPRPGAAPKRPAFTSAMANQQELLEQGFKRIKETAQAKTAELAEDVASVLGEEMQSVERRQKEQQESMKHAQASLMSLRSMVWKLSETFEEIGKLTARLSKDDPKHIHVDEDAARAPSPLNRIGSTGAAPGGLVRMRSGGVAGGMGGKFQAR